MKNILRKFMFVVIGTASTVVMVYILNAYHGSKEVVYNNHTVIEREAEEGGIPPVMQRIAECESDNKHYGQSGQVLMIGNTNNSVDVGRYQINTLWFNTANELGYDLTNESDNEAFALYLYENYGTEPWIWSKKCWVN